ncbi:uncharacterized protein LOC125031192 [Penaeus chinensis]|uniref:uncharacterized protein LOC125031192 n=1 Tax=Penaeus chinensis TaxID=139456 RepID=UPI001FB5A32F|nr:uncharacterized protein LOC125031192 [Penaeus chinensis]
MQSSGLVLWLVAVACACEPCQASSSGSSHQRPRNPLLAVVRAAKALHHHPPAAQPPPSLLPLLPSSALLEYPHLSRRHHAGPDLPQGALFPAQHRRRSPAGLQHLQRQQSAGGDDLQPPLEVQDLPDDERGEAEERRRTWSKRGQLSDAPVSGGAGDGQDEAVAAGLQQVGASIATNFLRHARSGPRPYDVPRIDCPAAEDQVERFPCPSPDRMGRYRCIDDHVLCDGFIDCPSGEDEDRRQCMFYKTTKAHLDVLADAIIRWARGGK